ncbi:MAG: DUF167 domain-containing protein [Pseudomonadota bacterium]
MDGGVRLAVQVMPNAKKCEVLGPFDGALKIRLQAQPIDGKANEALIRFLASLLDVPKSALVLTHGQSGRRKVIDVRGSDLTVDGVRNRLLPLESGGGIA